jgi:hypothetical protein
MDERQIAQLKLQQDRIFAVTAVQNLMGTYCFYHFANMYDDPRYPALFAKDPDTKLQTSRGVWVGEDAAERFCKYYLAMSGGKGYAGHMHMHPVMNPVIVVAGDAKTAKGLWVSPGIEVSPQDGVGKGMWLTVKYGVDFKNMEGEWKIWHLRVNGVYLALFGSDSVGGPLPPPPGGGGMPMIDPSFGPDLSYVGQPLYSATTVQVLDPLPPEPYETWDASMSYLP